LVRYVTVPRLAPGASMRHTGPNRIAILTCARFP
jgi:hypothetical protein